MKKEGRKKQASKVKQTTKAKQHNTPKAHVHLSLSPSLSISRFKSLIDRRGVMDEAYLAALEEENSNYGATSSVPKVYNTANNYNTGALPPLALISRLCPSHVQFVV